MAQQASQLGGRRIITLESDKQTKLISTTAQVKQTDLTLISYRVDLRTASTIAYRELGVSIGGIVGSVYLIDQVEGSYLLRIPLDKPPAGVTIGGTICDVTFNGSYGATFTMSGDLDKSFYMSVYYLDRTVTPNRFVPVPDEDLKYINLVFNT